MTREKDPTSLSLAARIFFGSQEDFRMDLVGIVSYPVTVDPKF